MAVVAREVAKSTSIAVGALRASASEALAAVVLAGGSFIKADALCKTVSAP
ncbi:hypothetical protein Pogu_2683 [Pyrobaculum oguniense TE7]|uniref:Uncharacterized protein n=1 Tax=Pyrobaculum oguniense (strain DSM 13380 / JCM 10595 / TE7) TaxID=698757 RepID=H6QDU0_PYROT|nr:hypothetical protein Pogu_2683 [Pyrobaculum oguniense TE7]